MVGADLRENGAEHTPPFPSHLNPQTCSRAGISFGTLLWTCPQHLLQSLPAAAGTEAEPKAPPQSNLCLGSTSHDSGRV